jgi:hypothetical protein
MIVAGAYAATVVMIIALFYEIQDTQWGRADVLEGGSIMILIAQVCMFVLLGSLAVSSAVRRDIVGHQMDSHRLMPLSPIQAIFGYLIGAGLRIISLCAVNVFIGMFLFGLRGIPVQIWLVDNAVLLGFSLAVWTMMVLAAFVSRWVFWLLIALFAAVGFTGGFIFTVLPGFLVFCTPMHGPTIFQVDLRSSNLSNGSMVGLAAQGLVAFLCIRAAARKYADGSALGLRIDTALALTGLWAAMSWFGILDFFDLRPTTIRYSELNWRVIVIGGIASTLLFAALVIATVAWSDILRQQRHTSGQSVRSPPWVFWICLAICLVFVLGLLTAQPYYSIPNPWQYVVRNGRVFPSPRSFSTVHVVHQRIETAVIGIAAAIFLLQAYLLMRLLYPVMRSANGLIAFIVILLWFGPLVGDLTFYGMQNADPKMDTFAPYSPLGTMIQAMQPHPQSVWQGLFGQGLICLSLMMIFWLVQSRRNRAIRDHISFPVEAGLPIALPDSVSAAAQ